MENQRFNWDPEGMGNDHIIGDLNCKGCGWTKAFKCEREGCSGIMHTEFGDENYDGYWVHHKCDQCGW